MGDTQIELALLVGYIDKVQSSGILTFPDAYLIKTSIDYLANGNQEDADIITAHVDEKQAKATVSQIATNIVIGTLFRGQAKGVFTLNEAASICKLLKLKAAP